MPPKKITKGTDGLGIIVLVSKGVIKQNVVVFMPYAGVNLKDKSALDEIRDEICKLYGIDVMIRYFQTADCEKDIESITKKLSGSKKEYNDGIFRMTVKDALLLAKEITGVKKAKLLSSGKKKSDDDVEDDDAEDDDDEDQKPKSSVKKSTGKTATKKKIDDDDEDDEEDEDQKSKSVKKVISKTVTKKKTDDDEADEDDEDQKSKSSVKKSISKTVTKKKIDDDSEEEDVPKKKSTGKVAGKVAGKVTKKTPVSGGQKFDDESDDDAVGSEEELE